jgi:hypothetical protein
MVVTYERDDQRRVAVVRLTGSFNPTLVRVVLERHELPGAEAYGQLHDARGLHGRATLQDMQQVLAARSLPDLQPGRGPLAILTTDPDLYALGCSYIVRLGPDHRVQVFNDWQEARDWLALELSKEAGL